MEPLAHDLARLLQLLKSFQCQKVPCDLLIRACESRPTWSSTGEIIDRLPLEAGIPEWLVNFYDVNKSLLHGTEQEGYKAHIKYTTGIDGVAYLEVTSEGQPDLEVIDEHILARDRIAIILQAFPSKDAEIIGEEIIERLMDVVKTAILPLFLSLTEADIKDWLLPRIPNDREIFLTSMVEFLYQVIDRLGIENPLIPLTMLRQLSSVVEDRTVTNIFIFLSKFSQVLDAYNDSNTLQSSFWPPGTRTNQRSNALMGYLFSMQLSNEESMGEPKDTAESLAGALSDWRPLSLSKPSTMEYLAATSFCNWTHVKMITKPSFTTVDTMALQGLVLSRRNQHKYAAELLNSTTGVITSQYGSCSMQVGIVTAELANCYNILRQENKAESRIITTLQERDGRSLSTRRDTIYLGLALSDSLIGRARYSQAVPVLESIIDSHDVSAKLRMMGVLRLARSRRRMHEDTQSAFEENSPLWTGLTLLSQAPEALTMEYVEELGCSISEIPKQQLQSSKQVQELIKAVDFVMCGSGYLADSPCREWYTKVRQEYLRQISVSSKAKEGKEVDDGSRNEVENGLGTPLSPHTSAHSPPGADDEMSESDDKGPWSEKLILTFDFEGVRAVSCLLILKHLMHEIRELEFIHEDGPVYSSSSRLPAPHTSDVPRVSDRVDEFLPCHYFDYMAGTSTGGLNSIMLGRLRMSVDEAIDNFIDYASAVFGHPREFYALTPGAKYSSAKACEAFTKIISNGIGAWDTNLVRDEPFIPFGENGRRTRTLIVSSYRKNKEVLGYTWKSFGILDSKTQPSHSAKIWEVACATCATPNYFDPAEIKGEKYYDGTVITGPMMCAIEEIYDLHKMIPAVLVNLGKDGIFRTARGDIPVNIGERWREFLGRNKQEDAISRPPSPIIFEQSHLKWYLRSRVYTLSPEEDLDDVPYDDWRPPMLGKQALQKVKDITNDYLEKDEVRAKIRRIAQEAVRIRRARARTEQWKDFV